MVRREILHQVNTRLEKAVHTAESLKGKKLFSVFDRPLNDTQADALAARLQRIVGLRVRGVFKGHASANPTDVVGRVLRMDYHIFGKPLRTMMVTDDQHGSYSCDAETIQFV